MTLLLFLEHVMGFAAPAIVVALLLMLGLRAPASRFKRPTTRLALLVGAGLLVLLAGLVFFGRDGKMATYAALVLVQGSLAWWLRGR